MEGVEELAKSKEYNNYNSVSTSLSLIGRCLEPYTLQQLKSVHTQVKSTLASRNLSMCDRKCSEKNPKSWCQTCLLWKQELLPYLADHRTEPKWRKLKSWKWPEGPEHIAEVFLPSNWATETNLKDLSTSINVWEKCKIFPRHLLMSIRPLRKLRNVMFHKYSITQKITDADKKDIFKRIFNTLKVPDIQTNIQDMYDDLLKTLLAVENHGMKTKEEKLVKELEGKVEQMPSEFRDKHEKLNKQIKIITAKVDIMVLAFLGIIFAVLLHYNFGGKRLQEYEQRDVQGYKYRNEGCLSEEPHVLFKEQSIYMYDYIAQHSLLIGRQWFFESLDNNWQANSTKHGVLVIAGMGYGKSALVANVICASSKEASNRIRRHLVAYHICRFDSVITKKRHIFIRRLASFFSNNIPGFADVLTKHYTLCVEYYNSEACHEDPYGCLTHCLILPLKSIPEPEKTYNVLIDALDECEDTRNQRNSDNDIAFLLKSNLYSFPEWIKFIITCRNVAYCTQLTAQLQTMNIDLQEKQNQEDIKKYLRYHGHKDGKTEGLNFLLLTFNFTSNESLRSVDIFYEQQFRRYFRKSNLDSSVIVLEVICSMFEATTEQRLLDIILNTGKVTSGQYEEIMIHLSNFVRHIGGRMYIWHVSLKEWLLTTGSRFKINMSRGHYHIAKYLLRLFQTQHSDDVLNLVAHASLANNFSSECLREFDSLNISDVVRKSENRTEYILHRFVSQFDDYLAVAHLSKQFPSLETLDQNKVTPLYLSASHGNLESLKSLVRAGADIHFRTHSFMHIINLENAVQISLETHHWDYGILDIASQNGHLMVVKYIVKYLNYDLTKRNGMHLLPIHLSCKLGHTDIVKYLYRKHGWMVDSLCLYFASEQGHTELVSFLLRIHVKDECKPCEPKLQYIPVGKLRIQGQAIHSEYVDDYSRIYVIYDDWNQITCETALHSAVRLNQVQVVKLLIKSKPSAFHCHDRAGRTPLLSALQYDRTEIIKEFIESKLVTTNMRCGKTKPFADFNQLNKVENDTLNTYFCCEGCTVLHIAAYFDRVWFVQLLPNFTISQICSLRDENGYAPIHTAVCMGSNKILKYIFEITDNKITDCKCGNGLTPIEVAASCASYESFRMIQSKYRPQSLTKKLTQSIVFKALNRSSTDVIVSHAKAAQISLCNILDLVLDSDMNINLQNQFKQNIFHISLVNGHFGVVSHAFAKNPDISRQLMRERDGDAETPLHLAISALKDTENVFFISHRNSSKPPFDFLPSSEYAILIALEFVERYSLFSDADIKNMILTLVRKNYGSIVLNYLPRYPRYFGDNEFINQILVQDSNFFLSSVILSHWLDYRMNSGVPKILMCVNNCEAVLRKCHLHIIALKHREMAAVFSKTDDVVMVDFKLNRQFPGMLSSCYDKDGYNVLERAVQGRSPLLVTYLLDIGVKSKKQVTELIRLAISPFPSVESMESLFFVQNMSNEYKVLKVIKKSGFIENLKKHIATKSYSDNFFRMIPLEEFKNAMGYKHEAYKSLDIVISTLIVKYHQHLNTSSVCMKGKRQFSLVHTAAMHSMSLTLLNISKFFGKDVLNCSNFHSVTPLYMAKALRQQKVVDMLEGMNFHQTYNENINKHLPVEILLIFLTKMYGKDFIKCVFGYGYAFPRNMYKIIKGYTCIAKVSKALKNRPYSKRIIHLYTYLQLKHVCTALCSDHSLQNRKMDSSFRFKENVFNRFATRMDFFLLKILQDFRMLLDKHFGLSSPTARKVIEEYSLIITEVKSYRSSLADCPTFYSDIYRDGAVWGFLRNEFRNSFYVLRTVIAVEICRIVRNTLLFSKNVTEIRNALLVFRNIPAYDYVSDIKNYPFFENTYNVLLKLTRDQTSLFIVSEVLKSLQYRDWSRQADRIRNEHFDVKRNRGIK